MVLQVKPKIAKKAQQRIKVLTIDIETAPSLAYVWGFFKQNIGLNQVVEQTRMLCWVGKWYDAKQPIFYSEHADGHETMVRAAWEALNDADIVITYNGDRFDIKHLNREFAELGLAPPKPFKSIDLFKVVKKEFAYSSNKLDNITQRLGLPGKLSHTGFDLWLGCMSGDEKSWKLMERYNRKDVVITERLYDRLRGWIRNHPHIGQFTGEEWTCANCGNSDISRNRQGEAFTFVQKYKAFQCPKCQAWLRGNKRLQNPVQTRSYR